MKVLINLPCLKLTGGVSNHFIGLRNFWTLDVTYNEVGKRYGISSLLLLPFDYIKFIIKCWFDKYDVVLLNPSLGIRAIMRDSLFLKIAKYFNKKVFVFIHGWESDVELLFNDNKSLFKSCLGSADGFIVLSSTFKNQLVCWGIKVPIYLMTTKVDDRLLYGFNVKEKANKYNSILFLARVELEKGIIIAIDTFKRLQSNHRNLKLNIVGTGSALKIAKNYVDEEKISNVEFWGNLSGDELINSFRTNDIYLLPTYHGEGMPTSVLEAMAFGLPIVTRPVGGIMDFFETEKMGYLIDSLDPDDFALAIEYLIENPVETYNISVYNHNYALKNFLASIVSKKIEDILIS